MSEKLNILKITILLIVEIACAGFYTFAYLMLPSDLRKDSLSYILLVHIMLTYAISCEHFSALSDMINRVEKKHQPNYLLFLIGCLITGSFFLKGSINDDTIFANEKYANIAIKIIAIKCIVRFIDIGKHLLTYIHPIVVKFLSLFCDCFSSVDYDYKSLSDYV